MKRAMGVELKLTEKSDECPEVVLRQRSIQLMAVVAEQVFKAGGADIVQQTHALAYSSQRGGIEFLPAALVDEADIVGTVGSVDIAGVAARTLE